MTACIKKNFFKKMAVMPKGKLLKMKGIICNIPVNEVDVNCKSWPRPADSNSLLIVKLKHKLEYKLHVVFESVRLALDPGLYYSSRVSSQRKITHTFLHFEFKFNKINKFKY